jgi:hypothetical protein
MAILAYSGWPLVRLDPRVSNGTSQHTISPLLPLNFQAFAQSWYTPVAPYGHKAQLIYPVSPLTSLTPGEETANTRIFRREFVVPAYSVWPIDAQSTKVFF